MLEKTEIFFTENSHEDLSQHESPEANIKYQFYDFFGTLFKSGYMSNLNKKKQIFIDVVISIIFSLQLNSFCWYSNMSITNWSSYKFFWECLGYFNIENLCEFFDIFDVCFYGVFAYVSYVIFIILSLGILKIYWKFTPEYIVLVSQKFIFPLAYFTFIPILTILVVGFKYLTNTQTKQAKYDTNSNLKSISIGIYGAIFCIIYIAFFFIFAISYEMLTAELRHSSSKRNIKAKSNSELDILLIIFYGLICILYYCFDESTVLYLQCFQAIFSSIFTYLFIKNMPYYNTYANSIQACGLCSLSVTSLSFFFAEFINDTSITIIFFLFLQPILMTLAIRRIKLNQIKIQNYSFNNQSEFELKIRNLLINYEDSNKDLIFEMFSKFSNDNNIKKSDLYVIWETNFCLYTLNDIRLARVKLLKIKNLYSTIEGGVQKWKIDKKIKNENLSDMRYKSFRFCRKYYQPLYLSYKQIQKYWGFWFLQ
ncbi:unnamed protein product [Blepharisma stoltei]|uniref:Transmembrane protein n=1 Tax=Blepharisma stoltei TaxID=1481888 RepID=A0AAU9JIP6_9CILI|nr:unnamed protein product [Blepharisma stoltei]